jgi:myo-inositol-1(or 4)-monophosphatase
LSDKLANVRELYRDYVEIGDKLWERFNQKDKNMHAWYYRGIAERLNFLTDTIAYNEYIYLLDKVFG